MIGAALLGFLVKTRRPAEHRQQDTSTVVTLVNRLFVLMTSLVLGFMINSGKNTLETNNGNLRRLATDIILLDRAIRGLGPEAEDTHRYLAEYLQTALGETNILEENPQAEVLLNAAGDSLKAIQVSDEQKVRRWNDALLLYRQIVQERWVLVDAAGGTIPTPLIIMLILWLTVIFSGFGHLAPRNAFVGALLFLAALLISVTFYLVLNMDKPSSSVLGVSYAPFQRALAQLQR